MSSKIEKVAVLGAGTMGSQIAGHLANAGIPSMLFDIKQELAENGLKKLNLFILKIVIFGILLKNLNIRLIKKLLFFLILFINYLDYMQF